MMEEGKSVQLLAVTAILLALLAWWLWTAGW